jgi:L-lactate dehydrogenase (cytochrome)
VGERYRDTRNGMTVPVGPLGAAVKAIDLARHLRWVRDVAIGGKPLTFGNLEKAVPGASTPEAFKDWVDSQFDPSVTWRDIEWVREHWKGPVVLKGVLDPEDARHAAEVGVEGIVVSNHGGRQLDATTSTISALPAVVDAVGGRSKVLFDGGIRSGLDVVKSMALGADAVLIGRAWAWAVAGGGQAGVAHVLDTVESELRVAMALCGATDVNDLDGGVLLHPGIR